MHFCSAVPYAYINKSDCPNLFLKAPVPRLFSVNKTRFIRRLPIIAYHGTNQDCVVRVRASGCGWDPLK